MAAMHTYALLGIALALVVLAGRLFLKYQKTPSIQYYASMFLGLAFLAAITAAIPLTADDGLALFLTRLGYLVGVGVFSMMLLFSWYYPVPMSMPKKPELFWIIPMVFFFPFALMSDMLVQGVERTERGIGEVAGPGFLVFIVVIAASFVWSLVNLGLKLRFVAGAQRRNTIFVLLGLVLGAGSSVIFDGLLPLFGHPVRHYVSVELSSVLIGCTAYIATRK